MNNILKILAKYSLLSLCFIIAGVLSGLIVMNIVIKTGEVKVPEIINKPIDQALMILGENNLYPVVEGRAYDKDIPIYHIISQNPKPRTIVKKGRTVKILVSKGSKVILSPDLTGKMLRDAELILSEMQLKLGKIVKVHSQKYMKDACISQLPLPENRLSPGESIDLLVSLGPYKKVYIMPELIDLKEDEAYHILNGMDINLGQLRRVSTSFKPNNTVLEQIPKPGYPIEEGTQVSLVVSKKKERYNSTQIKTFRPFTFRVPPGKSEDMRSVRVIAKNALGTKELYNKITPSGKIVNLFFEDVGKTTVTVLIDGEEITEKNF